jgi:hypothetical protein
MQDELKKLIPNKDFLQSKYKIFNEPTVIPYEKIIEFITLVYHPKSPIIYIDNHIKRKFEAANICEFPKSGTRFKKDIEDIILSRDLIVNKMVIAYSRLFRNIEFSELVTATESVYKEMEQLQNLDYTKETTALAQKQIADTKAKNMQNINELKKRISELRADFLSEDNSRELLAELYDEVENELGCPSPESVAQDLKEGKEPFPNFCPYEQ